ncbi:sulfhydryl oxidase 2-like [Tubulanus polymorphus]|uniref:sulfhydryl oxidase 2-like n=1 Tax=Tubulanus polymorphus TaxID=672921 RepID=UPI003DA39699
MMRYFGLVLLISCLIGPVISSGLYSLKDGVIVLHDQNIGKELNGSAATLVEFYSSWCGHCIRFAPTYKKLAKDVEGWLNYVKIAAIDCASPTNTKICRNYDIEGYPTLKIFPPNAGNDKGTMIENYDPDENKQIKQIRERLIDFIEQYAREKKFNWEDLPPFTPVKNIADIRAAMASKLKHTLETVAVVVENNPESFLARELLLDMSSFGQILVYRMMGFYASEYNLRSPGLYLLKKDNTFHPLVENSTNHREDFKLALYQVNPETAMSAKQLSENQVKAAKADQIEKPVSPQKAVKMQDLESALYYSLTHEVSIQKNITGDSLQALKMFIALNIKFFPGRPEITKFLQFIYEWLLTKQWVSGEGWQDHLYHSQNKTRFIPDPPYDAMWTGCQGSKSIFRGYPCGLWTLFHTLSVTHYMTRKADANFNHKEVVIGMRTYIKNFFGCQECAKNFDRGTASFESKMLSANCSVLYLWWTHNIVNDRLKGDLTEDPLYPKVQFPTRVQCPKCRLDPDTKDLKVITKPKWNETKVLEFMIDFYRKANIVQDSKGEYVADPADREWIKQMSEHVLAQIQRKVDIPSIGRIHSLKRNKVKKTVDSYFRPNLTKINDRILKLKERERNTRYTRGKPVLATWGFNSIDISMCVLFYVICSGIMLLLYFHFTLRKRGALSKCPI